MLTDLLEEVPNKEPNEDDALVNEIASINRGRGRGRRRGRGRGNAP